MQQSAALKTRQQNGRGDKGTRKVMWQSKRNDRSAPPRTTFANGILNQRNPSRCKLLSIPNAIIGFYSRIDHVRSATAFRPYIPGSWHECTVTVMNRCRNQKSEAFSHLHVTRRKRAYPICIKTSCSESCQSIIFHPNCSFSLQHCNRELAGRFAGVGSGRLQLARPLEAAGLAPALAVIQRPPPRIHARLFLPHRLHGRPRSHPLAHLATQLGRRLCTARLFGPSF